MSNSQHICDSVLSILSQQCPTERVTQARNLAWFITGLVVAAHCQLTRIAPHLPWDGERASVRQRLRRIVMNSRLEVRILYGPTVGYLWHWLDGPDGIVLLIGIAFRGRVLPLTWKVQKKQGSFQRCYIKAAWRFIAQWVPLHAQIGVVGDRASQWIEEMFRDFKSHGWDLEERAAASGAHAAFAVVYRVGVCVVGQHRRANREARFARMGGSSSAAHAQLFSLGLELVASHPRTQ